MSLVGHMYDHAPSQLSEWSIAWNGLAALPRIVSSIPNDGQGLYLIITSLHNSPDLRIFNGVKARLAYVDGSLDLEWAE